MTKPLPSDFMKQLLSAMTQLSARWPSLPCRVLAYSESVPSGLCGSYVSFAGEDAEHIVGLLSNTLGWEALASALDRDLPLAEPRGLIEAACELSKLAAQSFQTRRSDAASSVIGLPLFAEGLVSSGRRTELQAANIALGPSLVLLVLFSRAQRRDLCLAKEAADDRS